MRETPDELAALQKLLDRSFERSSEHLRAIMEPQRRLSAESVVDEVPSPAVLNIASVTARGEPRLSAVDGHFIHGHWYFTTERSSPKAVHWRARPAVSASYTPRDGYGVFCHGRVVELAGDEQQMLREHFIETYGQSPEELGDIFYARIDASWFVAFSMTAEEEAEIAKAAAERAARRAGG